MQRLQVRQRPSFEHISTPDKTAEKVRMNDLHSDEFVSDELQALRNFSPYNIMHTVKTVYFGMKQHIKVSLLTKHTLLVITSSTNELEHEFTRVCLSFLTLNRKSDNRFRCECKEELITLILGISQHFRLILGNLDPILMNQICNVYPMMVYQQFSPDPDIDVELVD